MSLFTASMTFFTVGGRRNASLSQEGADEMAVGIEPNLCCNRRYFEILMLGEKLARGVDPALDNELLHADSSRMLEKRGEVAE